MNQVSVTMHGGKIFPVRPGAKDCSYFLANGDCGWGEKCMYNHPPELSSQAPQTSFPVNPGAKDCAFYLEHGDCGFGPTCKFNHPPRPSNSNQAGLLPSASVPLLAPFPFQMAFPPPAPPMFAPVPNPDIFNIHIPDGLMTGERFQMVVAPFQDQGLQIQNTQPRFPVNPGAKDCAYYMDHGDCKFGSVCKFNHPPRATDQAPPEVIQWMPDAFQPEQGTSITASGQTFAIPGLAENAGGDPFLSAPFGALEQNLAVGAPGPIMVPMGPVPALLPPGGPAPFLVPMAPAPMVQFSEGALPQFQLNIPNELDQDQLTLLATMIQNLAHQPDALMRALLDPQGNSGQEQSAQTAQKVFKQDPEGVVVKREHGWVKTIHPTKDFGFLRYIEGQDWKDMYFKKAQAPAGLQPGMKVEFTRSVLNDYSIGTNITIAEQDENQEDLPGTKETGRIKLLKDGYGFIRSSVDDEDVYFKPNDACGDLQIGTEVEYIRCMISGKANALNIKIISANPLQNQAQPLLQPPTSSFEPIQLPFNSSHEQILTQIIQTLSHDPNALALALQQLLQQQSQEPPASQQEQQTPYNAPQRETLHTTQELLQQQPLEYSTSQQQQQTPYNVFEGATLAPTQEALPQTEGFPINSGAPNCAFYMQRGTCVFGASCKYNHPPKIMQQESPVEVLPINPGAPNCAFYMQRGTCVFGASCKYNHPLSTLEKFQDQETAMGLGSTVLHNAQTDKMSGDQRPLASSMGITQSGASTASAEHEQEFFRLQLEFQGMEFFNNKKSPVYLPNSFLQEMGLASVEELKRLYAYYLVLRVSLLCGVVHENNRNTVLNGVKLSYLPNAYFSRFNEDLQYTGKLSGFLQDLFGSLPFKMRPKFILDKGNTHLQFSDEALVEVAKIEQADDFMSFIIFEKTGKRKAAPNRDANKIEKVSSPELHAAGAQTHNALQLLQMDYASTLESSGMGFLADIITEDMRGLGISAEKMKELYTEFLLLRLLKLIAGETEPHTGKTNAIAFSLLQITYSIRYKEQLLFPENLSLEDFLDDLFSSIPAGLKPIIYNQKGIKIMTVTAQAAQVAAAQTPPPDFSTFLATRISRTSPASPLRYPSSTSTLGKRSLLVEDAAEKEAKKKSLSAVSDERSPLPSAGSNQTSYQVLVSGLEKGINESTLTRIFSQFGEIKRFQIAENRATGEFQGFSLVEYFNLEAAERAVKFSGSTVLGMVLQVTRRY